MIDKLAERVTEWVGSTPFFVSHIIWFALWLILGLSQELLTLTVSLEAIFLTILILRAQNVQGKRWEIYIKQAMLDTKKDLKLSDDILSLLKKK